MLFGLNENVVVAPVAQPTKLFNESFDFVAMEQEMLVESARAWNKIETMIGEANCRLIHEAHTNPDGVSALMENAIGGFFKKVKEFFVKLKNMILEVFSKFMMWVNSKIKSEKDFATKYEKELLAKIVAIGEVEVKGFKYNLDKEIPSFEEFAPKTLDGDTEDAKKDFAKKQEGLYRGRLVGDSGEVDSDELSTKLYEYYRNKESEPDTQTIKRTDVANIISELKTFAKTKETIEKERAKAEKSLNKIIKEIEDGEKKVDKTEESNKNLLLDIQIGLASLKTMGADRNQAFVAKIAAVKERADYGKKVLLAVKSAKKENNSVTSGLFAMDI